MLQEEIKKPSCLKKFAGANLDSYCLTYDKCSIVSFLEDDKKNIIKFTMNKM